MKTEVLKKIRETNSTNEKMYIASSEFDVETHKFMEECFNDEIYGISETNIGKAIGYDSFAYGKFEDLGDFLEKYPRGPTIKNNKVTIKEFLQNIRGSSGNEQISILKKMIDYHINKEEAPWYIRILLKNPRIGMSLTNYNKVREKCNLPKIQKHFVKLATLMEPEQFETLPYPVFAEVKYDGERATIYYKDNNLKIMSRNGNNITNQFPEIVKKIKESFDENIKEIILDGEIISKTFNSLQKRMNRIEKNINEDYDLTFVCFDIIKINKTDMSEMEQYKRRAFLEELFIDKNINFKLSECQEFKYKKDLQEFYEKCINNKEEGIMIKEITSYWKDDRKQWYKVKPVYTSEMEVFKYDYGKGKNKDYINILYVKDKNGVIKTKVSSGINDEMRKYLTKIKDDIIGKIVEIKYNSVTDTNSLRHPRFTKIRYDKDTADEIK